MQINNSNLGNTNNNFNNVQPTPLNLEKDTSNVVNQSDFLAKEQPVQQSVVPPVVEPVQCGERYQRREYKNSLETGVVETVYIYICPNCKSEMEFKAKVLNTMKDNPNVHCYQCSHDFDIIKPNVNDYQNPSIMDTFGDFIKSDNSVEGQHMLDNKNVDDVLNTIKDSFGINIPKESLNKLPIGVKKILRDLFSI